ncbi:MAG TPA: UDP-2,3-diacylglucosamine diphosphatase LpxI [Spirochaetota bacterium]|mgnify:FL=1|nr:UDP-2,3-diacylglucosamine diphosphatase LpxI [Spirochaetota bacterium]
MAEAERIGLIAGDGTLPVTLARRLEAQGLLAIVIVLQGNTERFGLGPDLVIGMPPGMIKRILKKLKAYNVNRIIMLGTISKQGFIERKGFDLYALKAFKRLRNDNDMTLFGIINETFEEWGMTVLPQDKYLADCIANTGVLTKKKPRGGMMDDAVFGMGLTRQFASMDIGQSIVVKNGTVLAIETVEGTDETIRRGGALGKKGSVVCKAARKNQDPRFDIPAVGAHTITTMAHSGCAMIALEAGRMFLVDRDETIRLADSHGIVIVGV